MVSAGSYTSSTQIQQHSSLIHQYSTQNLLHICTNSFITDSTKFNTKPATHLHKFNIIQHHSTNLLVIVLGGIVILFGGIVIRFGGNVILFGGIVILYGGIVILFGGIVILFGGIVILFGGIVIHFEGIVISFWRGTNRWCLQDPTPLQHKFNSIHH
jgi:hypothetical protein